MTPAIPDIALPLPTPPLPGMFLTKLGPLVNHGGFTLLGTRPAAGDPNTLVVSVSVQLDTTPALQKFDFLLRQKKVCGGGSVPA